MSLTQASRFECPYCMTINDLDIDTDNDINQQQVLDCQICCQPILITVYETEHGLTVEATQENE